MRSNSCLDSVMPPAVTPYGVIQSVAVYYVTICTGGRELYLGDVVNGQMIFSDIGQKANGSWKGIPEHFKFVWLDEFQIKPNHVHGLIEINHNLLKGEKIPDNRNVDRGNVETANLDVSDNQDVSNNPENRFGPDNPGSISKNGDKQIIEPNETPKLVVSTPAEPNEDQYRTLPHQKNGNQGHWKR